MLRPRRASFEGPRLRSFRFSPTLTWTPLGHRSVPDPPPEVVLDPRSLDPLRGDLGIGDALRRRHGHAERRRRGALGSGGPGGPGVTGGRGDEGDGPRGSPGSLAGGPRLVPRAGSPLLGRGPLDRPTRPLLRRVLAGHVPRSTGLNPTSPARRRSTGLGSSPGFGTSTLVVTEGLLGLGDPRPASWHPR
jgi:hypothetical protein